MYTPFSGTPNFQTPIPCPRYPCCRNMDAGPAYNAALPRFWSSVFVWLGRTGVRKKQLQHAATRITILGFLQMWDPWVATVVLMRNHWVMVMIWMIWVPLHDYPWLQQPPWEEGCCLEQISFLLAGTVVLGAHHCKPWQAVICIIYLYIHIVVTCYN